MSPSCRTSQSISNENMIAESPGHVIRFCIVTTVFLQRREVPGEGQTKTISGLRDFCFANKLHFKDSHSEISMQNIGKLCKQKQKAKHLIG
jgi:hypothetical protein